MDDCPDRDGMGGMLSLCEETNSRTAGDLLPGVRRAAKRRRILLIRWMKVLTWDRSWHSIVASGPMPD